MVSPLNRSRYHGVVRRDDQESSGGAEFHVEPVARTRAYEEVARQLRELMQRGTFGAGDRLPPERDLARRFQVSRATIRQALSALSSAGLIESRVGEGTFARGDIGASVTDLAAVLRTADASLADQLALRRLIEPQVAHLAAEHGEEADLDDLGQYLSLQEARLGDGVPFVDEDSAFHLAIARATKNSLLVKMVEGVHELLRASREHSLRAPGGMECSLEGHRRILRAISEHDGPAAYDAMLGHLQDVERLSLQTLAAHDPGGTG